MDHIETMGGVHSLFLGELEEFFLTFRLVWDPLAKKLVLLLLCCCCCCRCRCRSLSLLLLLLSLLLLSFLLLLVPLFCC
jgi:hypothetical protein